MTNKSSRNWIHLLWILAYPVYQTIGTLRHEGAHALAAMAEGATILEFVFWPTRKTTGGILWGYVQWSHEVSWVATAAPYFLDALTFLLFFIILWRVSFKRMWIWVNLLIIGLLSPLFNSVYNYYVTFLGRETRNDVGRLLDSLPAEYIHLYFLITILLYFLGILYIVLHKKPGQKK